MPGNKSETALTMIVGIGAALIGPWSPTMSILVGFMAADYISGCLVAIVKGDGLSSQIGAVGLLKKFAMIGIVAMGYQVDLLMGTIFLRDTCAYFYLANEAISILENAGRLGVPGIPPALIRMIALLKDKGDQTEPASDDSKDENRGSIEGKGAAE